MNENFPDYLSTQQLRQILSRGYTYIMSSAGRVLQLNGEQVYMSDQDLKLFYEREKLKNE